MYKLSEQTPKTLFLLTGASRVIKIFDFESKQDKNLVFVKGYEPYGLVKKLNFKIAGSSILNKIVTKIRFETKNALHFFCRAQDFDFVLSEMLSFRSFYKIINFKSIK